MKIFLYLSVLAAVAVLAYGGGTVCRFSSVVLPNIEYFTTYEFVSFLLSPGYRNRAARPARASPPGKIILTQSLYLSSGGDFRSPPLP